MTVEMIMMKLKRGYISLSSHNFLFSVLSDTVPTNMAYASHNERSAKGAMATPLLLGYL